MKTHAPPLHSANQETLNARFMLLGSLTLGVLWCVQTSTFSDPRWTRVALLAVGGLLIAAVIRSARWSPGATLGYACLVGIAERFGRIPFAGSDVLAATQEAIGVLAGGGNPYTHSFLTTNPPVSMFAYLPGEIAFYAIPHVLTGRIDLVDGWTGIAILLLLAMLAGRVGVPRAALAVALYGTFRQAAQLATDGSNDTALAGILVLGIVLLAWSQQPGQTSRVLYYGSAVVLAWALLFKQFAWVVYPFLAAYLIREDLSWRRHVTVTVGITGFVMLPFLIWAPGAFITDVFGPLSHHPQPEGLNLWTGLNRLAPSLVERLTPYIPVVGLIPVVTVFGILIRRPSTDLGQAVLRGVATLGTALFFARWTTLPYYTFAGALLIVGITLLGTDHKIMAVPIQTT